MQHLVLLPHRMQALVAVERRAGRETIPLVERDGPSTDQRLVIARFRRSTATAPLSFLGGFGSGIRARHDSKAPAVGSLVHDALFVTEYLRYPL